MENTDFRVQVQGYSAQLDEVNTKAMGEADTKVYSLARRIFEGFFLIIGNILTVGLINVLKCVRVEYEPVFGFDLWGEGRGSPVIEEPRANAPAPNISTFQELKKDQLYDQFKEKISAKLNLRRHPISDLSIILSKIVVIINDLDLTTENTKLLLDKMYDVLADGFNLLIFVGKEEFQVNKAIKLIIKSNPADCMMWVGISKNFDFNDFCKSNLKTDINNPLSPEMQDLQLSSAKIIYELDMSPDEKELILDETVEFLKSDPGAQKMQPDEVIKNVIEKDIQQLNTLKNQHAGNDDRDTKKDIKRIDKEIQHFQKQLKILDGLKK